MNISQIKTKSAHEKGAWLTVVDPSNKKDTEFKILLSGMDGNAYRSAMRGLSAKFVEVEKLDQDAEQAGILSSLVIDWVGLVDDDGKQVKFKKKIAEDLLNESPWLCLQIDIFVSNRANFING